MMMPDQDFSYKYLHTDTDSDTEEEVETKEETPEDVQQDEPEEQPENEKMCDAGLVFPNIQRYLRPVGKVLGKVANWVVSDTVANTADLLYDVFDYSARKIDAVVYTSLTYVYLSFCYMTSSFFTECEKAYKDLMFDGSRLLYSIRYDNKDTTQRFIVQTSRSAFDLYLPFTFLRHLRFRIWDSDSFLNRTFIPRSFIISTNEEVEKAIEEGYSIVVHPRSFLSDIENTNFSQMVNKHQLPIEVVDTNGLSNWFPSSSDFSIYTFPQVYPITLTHTTVAQVSTIETRPLSIASEERHAKPLLAVLSMVLMYPFQSTFNLVLKYMAIRNLNYNHSCFLNPETLLFLALIVYR
jgi:hypothetical protein